MEMPHMGTDMGLGLDMSMSRDLMDGEDALVATLDGDSDSDESKLQIRTPAVFNFPSPPSSPCPECKVSRRFATAFSFPLPLDMDMDMPSSQSPQELTSDSIFEFNISGVGVRNSSSGAPILILTSPLMKICPAAIPSFSFIETLDSDSIYPDPLKTSDSSRSEDLVELYARDIDEEDYMYCPGIGIGIEITVSSTGPGPGPRTSEYGTSLVEKQEVERDSDIHLVDIELSLFNHLFTVMARWCITMEYHWRRCPSMSREKVCILGGLVDILV